MNQKINTADFKSMVFDYEASQDWKYEGDLPAIIDFYADWCPPCKMVEPILDAISKEFAGRLNVYKINTDEETDLAQAFGISSIPSIMFIPKEGQPQMSVGALPKPAIMRAINELLQVN